MKDVWNDHIEKVKAYDSWLYDFDLGNGDFINSKLPESVKSTYYIRLDMVLQAVESHFGERPGIYLALISDVMKVFTYCRWRTSSSESMG